MPYGSHVHNATTGRCGLHAQEQSELNIAQEAVYTNQARELSSSLNQQHSTNYTYQLVVVVVVVVVELQARANRETVKQAVSTASCEHAETVKQG